MMNIRDYIEKERLTVKEFAENCCISEAALYRWLKGENIPSIRMARQVSRATGNQVTYEELRKIKVK